MAFVALEIFVIATCIGPWRRDREMAQARRAAQAGRHDEAIAHYANLLRQFPDSLTLNLEMGFACLADQRWNDAIRHLTAVAAQRGAPRDIHVYIGRAHIGLGDREGALERFLLALERNERDPVANYYIGDWLLERGEPLEAARRLERATSHPELGEAARTRLNEIKARLLG